MLIQYFMIIFLKNSSRLGAIPIKDSNMLFVVLLVIS